MDRKFNGVTVETNGVRSIAGGGTGAATAEQARINLELGTAATTNASAYATAAQGTDSRTPTAHKSSHATGGTDALTPADIDAASISDSIVNALIFG